MTFKRNIFLIEIAPNVVLKLKKQKLKKEYKIGVNLKVPQSDVHQKNHNRQNEIGRYFKKKKTLSRIYSLRKDKILSIKAKTFLRQLRQGSLP